jgi:pentalenolactone synthase
MFGDAADNYDTEKADHARMRRLLNQAFSPKRMQKLRSRMQADVDHLLGNVLSMTPPVDLPEEFSFPLPTLMICELLGVPFSDRGSFSALSSGIGDLFAHTRSECDNCTYEVSFRRDMEA